MNADVFQIAQIMISIAVLQSFTGVSLCLRQFASVGSRFGSFGSKDSQRRSQTLQDEDSNFQNDREGSVSLFLGEPGSS